LLLSDWAHATRGDLALLRQAINAGWPVPPPRAAALMEAAFAHFEADSPTKSHRRVIALARVALAADHSD
jgi:hypothetical protein